MVFLDLSWRVEQRDVRYEQKLFFSLDLISSCQHCKMNFYFTTCRSLSVANSGLSVPSLWSSRTDTWYPLASLLMNTLTLLYVMCFLDRLAHWLGFFVGSVPECCTHMWSTFLKPLWFFRVFLGLRSKSCSIGIPRVSKAPQRPYRIWSPSTNPKRKGTTSGPQLWQQLKYQSLLHRILRSA